MLQDSKIFFVSGIDTDIGKTYATAYYASILRIKGYNVVTQKPVQTGCVGKSEDLEMHDRLAGTEERYNEASVYRCSYLFPFPASPHLSARMEHVAIAPERIDDDSRALLSLGFNRVLMEGAGGLMVPLTESLLTIDFVARRGYPLCLVTSGRLGSLNHTLLSLEAIQHRQIPLQAILYNLYPGDKPEIEEETRHYLKEYLSQNFPNAEWYDVPALAMGEAFSHPKWEEK